MKMPFIVMIAIALFLFFTNAFYKVKETEQVMHLVCFNLRENLT